jgi:uncharacterized protein YjiS (DUF1127 family)
MAARKQNQPVSPLSPNLTAWLRTVRGYRRRGLSPKQIRHNAIALIGKRDARKVLARLDDDLIDPDPLAFRMPIDG